MPSAFREEFARAVNDRQTKGTGRSIEVRQKSATDRLARVRDLYGLGDLTREQYTSRRARLQAELAELEQAAPSSLIIASKQIHTLVDDWPRMDAAAKRQVLDTIFTDVQLEDGQLVSATPRAGWLAYLEEAIVPKARRVGAARGWWGSAPHGAHLRLALVQGRLVPRRAA